MPVAAAVRPPRYQELLPAFSGLAGLVVLLLLPGADWNYLLETSLAAGAIVLALLRLPLALHALSHLTVAYSVAHIDPLTGLASRHALHERLRRESTAMAAGYDGALLLVSIDLEDFTDLNAVLGHQAGDELLRGVADRLRAAVAALPLDCEHLLARATADEFVLLTSGPDADRPERVTEVVEALHNTLRDPFTLGSSRVSVGGHSGSVVARGAVDAEQMLRRIEAARSEAQTRDVASVAWNDGLDRTRLVRAEAAAELLAAIDDRQLVLHYQPQTHLASDRAAGMEALVRWQHPTRGLLYPDAFLPLAERAGLQQALTAEVLRIAVGQAAAWWSAGLQLPVSVNLSANDLFDNGLRGRILALLEAHDLPVEALHLEITETVAMADPEFAVGVVDALRAEGLQVSLDDFGTGYSSLAYLRRLQVDELKLDRSLIKDLTIDPRALAIVRSTLALAGSLGVRVVAEGVETERTWELLDREGCHLAQGFWRSRPLDVQAATAWLEQDRREAPIVAALSPAPADAAAPEPSAFTLAVAGRVVGRHARRTQPLRAGLLTSEVDALFRRDPALTSVLLPLFEGGPVTLLSRERLDLAMAGPLGYGRILHSNRPVERLLRPVPLVLAAEAPLGEAVAALLARDGDARFEDVPVRFPDGGWGLMRVQPVLTELAATFAHRSLRDPLTGLPNRTVLAAAVRTNLELESSVAMLFVDLDRFKSVNDTWGHDAGDTVLCEVAERLRRTVRAGAVVARLGGDQFGVLLPDVATAQEALTVGERIVVALAAPFHLPAGTAAIGASVGVALLQPGVDPIREAPHETLLTTDELLLGRADQAMYGAKTTGRGRVVPFAPRSGAP